MWERIQDWLFEKRVTSNIQVAGRKGFSCVHTALLLWSVREIRKSFDWVWTDGLFFQLHKLGGDPVAITFQMFSPEKEFKFLFAVFGKR